MIEDARHQLAQPAQRFAAVADLVLALRRQLRGRLAQLLDQEKRIISESVCAARRAQKSALPSFP